MNTGIYTITNLINNKIYVGSALAAFNKRFNQHKSDLKKNKHSNPHLQKAWNKYGKDNFIFEILETHPPEISISIELYWVNILNVRNSKYGYNINSPTEGRLGLKHTEESKLKMHFAQLGDKSHMYGKSLSKEHIEILIKKQTGKKHTKESKIKMSKARKGKNLGEENPFYGKKHSEETLDRLKNITKERWKNNKHPNLGKKASNELKQKLSKSHKGLISPKRKKVYQYTLDNIFIKEWSCAKEASEFLNKSSETPIQACCTGRTKKAFNFLWKYE